MDSSVDAEIVIIGGGICGLATALALHRKNIRSLVLERSETLRVTGVAIIMQANGWGVLDQLGIGPTLRQTAMELTGSRFVSIDKNGLLKEFPMKVDRELRCIKRTDLMEALASSLPEGTVRTNCQVLSVELDPFTHLPLIMLSDGSLLHAKVAIGCDGINSAIPSMFGLHRSKLLLFTTCAARGFTEYPNGHSFPSETVFVHIGHVQLGRLPMTDKLVYWFITRPRTSKDSRIWKEVALIKESLLEAMEGFPEEYVEMIRNCMLNSLHLTEVRYRGPWELPFNKFRKGTITVAGDAMHAAGPFIAQGGAASMEDAIVLARCLAKKMQNSNNDITLAAAEEAIDEYVRERKMRIFWLSFHSFLVGKLCGTKSSIVRFFIIAAMTVLFRDPDWHTRFHIGNL